MTQLDVTADERQAAAALLARCRAAGVSFGEAQVVVQRDIPTGRLSIASGGRVIQELPGGRLIAARRRSDGGIDLADLDGDHPGVYRRLFA